MDDLRDRLLAAFAIERAEHLAAMRAALDRAETGEPADLKDLFRRAHSLKGAARAVEMPQVEAEAHRLESALAAVESDTRSLDAATIAMIRVGLDRIDDEGLGAAGSADFEIADAAGSVDDHRLVRVPAAGLDQLARSIGGIGAVLAPRLRLRAELAALARELATDNSVEAGLRASRRLAAINRRMVADDALAAQALEGLDHDAQAVTLAPAADMLTGFDRMVRGIAGDAHKAVRLRITGGEIEADRGVLERLRDPLIHLARNAISHGIEPPAERIAAGKPSSGTIRVDITRTGGDLTISVQDDGRGLDRYAIAKAAGLSGALPPDEQLFARLFDQGLSTAGAVDTVAGRGVGLAVVAQAARQLGGRVRITPVPGAAGARVEISVPRTILRQMLLLVEAGGLRFALPASGVRGLVRIPCDAIEMVGRRPHATATGATSPCPVALLAAILGYEMPTRIADAYAAIELVDGGEPVLLIVDQLLAAEAHLVRGAGDIAVPAPLVHGLVIGEAGDVLVVLDPAALIAGARSDEADWRLDVSAPSRATPPATILIVDDSVTTRTLERSILETQGYRVLVAIDGVAALETLRSRVDEIAMIVADVEMPRLDGFGLLSAVRNDPALANIPVVMMTSRDNPDDVRRGLDLGANAYVTKQTFEAGALLETIARFV